MASGAGIQGLDSQAVISLVVDIDSSIAVQGYDFAGAGAEDLPEQFYVAAVHIDILQEDAVIDRVIIEAHIRFLQQRVIQVIQ